MTGDALALEERFTRLEIAFGRRGNGAGTVGDENGDDDRQQERDETDRSD